MLADKDAMATIAVSDMDRARAFYEGVLKLRPDGDADAGVATYRSGNASVVVYRSEFAATNRATSATWGVGSDFDAIVKALQAAGVPFEHYDFGEGSSRLGDVHLFGSFKAAWFKDPDGNILHINNM